MSAPETTPPWSTRIEAFLRENAARDGDTFVYQFGRGFGLCAEMAWLVSHLVACIERDVRFALGRNRASRGFSVGRGWEDYFEPAFPVVSAPFIERLNSPPLPLHRLSAPLAAAWLRATGPRGARWFMVEGFDTSLESLDAPLWGEPGISFWEACRRLLSVLWRLEPGTRAAVRRIRDRYAIEPPFAAVHIRRGDKITETPHVAVERYHRHVSAEVPEGWPLLLAGDDRDALEELEARVAGRHPVTTVESAKPGGHHQPEYNRSSARVRREETEAFLAELELMREADRVVCASTSNVGSFLRMVRGGDGWIDVTAAGAGG